MNSRRKARFVKGLENRNDPIVVLRILLVLCYDIERGARVAAKVLEAKSLGAKSRS